MNVRDFTFERYERLLETILEYDYEVVTVADFLARSRLPDRYVVLRHDVDRRLGIARSMARREANQGIAATYYLRTSTFDPAAVAEFSDLGHEVGYHYEDLTATGGDLEAAFDRFEANLERYRAHADVRTISAHGYPLSRHLNVDMWGDDRAPAAYGLTGEATLSIETDDADPAKPTYFSDTGRRWGTAVPSYGTVETTDDLIALLEAGACGGLYVLAHPGRWSRTPLEFADRFTWDLVAETGKQAVRPIHGVQSGMPMLTSTREARQSERTPHPKRS